MRRYRLAQLSVLLALSACGVTPSKPTLLVSCGGSIALAGAASIDVGADPASHTTVLSFPDPVNEGHTGTITVRNRCTITPKT